MKALPIWMPLAAFATALAWLLPNASPPWIAFHKDAWIATMLICVATSALVRYRGRATLTIDAFGLLLLTMALMAIWQWQVGVIHFFGHAAMGIAYLGAASLATVFGRFWYLANPREFGDFLFGSIMLAALATVVIIWIQWFDLNAIGIWIQEIPPGTAPHGNLNQPNNSATLLALGLVASAWFQVTGRLTSLGFGAALVLLATALAVTGSRIGYINTSLLFLIALIGYMQRANSRKELLALFFGMAAFLVALWVANADWGTGSELVAQVGVNVKAFERDLTSARLAVWQAYLAALISSPWYGFGYEQGLHTQIAAGEMGYRLNGLYTWSHNVWIDVATWFGVPISILLALVSLLAVVRFFRDAVGEKSWIMMAGVVPLVLHGMVELPLAFAYFLLPLCLLVGALTAAFRWPLVRVSFSAVFLWLIGLGILLVVILSDYFKIEDSFYTWRFEQARIGMDHPTEIPDALLLDQFEALLTGLRGTAENLSADQIDEFESSIAHDPSLAAIQHLAELRVQRRDIDGAQRAVDLAFLISNSSKRDMLRERWAFLANKDPVYEKVELPK